MTDNAAYKQLEERLNDIQKWISEGYYEIDLKGNFTFINDAFIRITGYTRQELMGMGYREYTSPEDANHLFRIFNKASETGESGEVVDFGFIRKDGSVARVEISTSLSRNPSGQPIGFYGIMRDRTEQKRVEERLRQSEESYRGLLELAPDAISVTRISDGRYVQVNNTFAKRTGYSAEEAVGRTISDLNIYADPSDRGRVLEALKRDGKIEAMEMKFRTKSGAIQDTLMSARPVSYQGDDCLLVVSANIGPLKQAQRNLRQKESKLRNILESINDGYYEVDLNGNLIYFNDALLQLSGYPRQELTGMNFRDFIAAEDAEKVYAVFYEIYRGTAATQFIEHSTVKKDGTRRMVETSISLARNASGEPAGFYGITRDRTEQKMAEEKLIQSEEGYRGILELAPDSITVGTIEDGRYLLVNDAFCKMSGYTAEEALGRTALELGLYADTKNREQMLNDLKRHGRVENAEIQFKTKSGRILQTLTSAIKIVFEGKDCLLVIVTDITSLKEAQDVLQQSEKKYRTILEGMEEGYYEIDLNGDFTYFNESTRKLHGYSADELMGMSYKQYLRPDTAKVFFNIFSKIFETGVPSTILEYEVIRKDGTSRICEMSAYLRRDPSGKPIGFWGIARDRTDQKKMEAQLLQSNKMEAIGTLAGGLAHDFNNLLMGIQGNAALMLMDIGEEDLGYDNLKSIEQYVKAGADLTKQLLGAAKGGKYEVKPTDMNRVVDASANLFGRTKKEIRIHKTLQTNLWTVEVDRGQIEQVLLNLYVNAWHAMPNGGDLYIESRNIELDEESAHPYGLHPGRHIRVTVTDTGTGIAPDDLKQIFDPFFTTKEMSRGTGLGLASAYGIISNHGGTITVYSEQGNGSTFNIYIPVTDKQVVTKREATVETISGNETVLLVDDDAGIVGVGRLILEKLGYHVMTAHSGQEAIDIYQQHQKIIDLVILDMIMPGLSGSETFNEMKAINPEISVILSSGYSINGQAKSIMESGCKGFIQKPYNIKELSIKLREVLDAP